MLNEELLELSFIEEFKKYGVSVLYQFNLFDIGAFEEIEY